MIMWKVTLIDTEAEEGTIPESVTTTNPESEVRRFLFKNPKADICVEYNDTLRRQYVSGKVVVDIIEYPVDKKTIDDYGDALVFMAFVGERRDYMQDINSKTKKQRDRFLSRRVEAVMKTKVI